MASSLASLRRAAESEMRRAAPEDVTIPPTKRQRIDGAAGEAAGRQIGRYDYAAARGISGPAFVVHCNFRRERSASKEAAEVLHHYLRAAGVAWDHGTAAAAAGDPAAAAGGLASDAAGGAREAAATQQAAAQQPSASAAAAAGTQPSEIADAVDAVEKNGPMSAAAADGPAAPVASAAAEAQAPQAAVINETPPAQADAGGSLAAVKLGCSGLMFLQLQGGAPPSVATAVVASLLADLAAGRRLGLQHCQRIVPVEAVCTMTECALAPAAQSVTAAWLASPAASELGEACSYAVAYKHRGPATGDKVVSVQPSQQAAAAATAASKAALSGAKAPAQPPAAAEQHTAAAASPSGSAAERELGRGEAIKIMAAAVAAAAAEAGKTAKVDLAAPEWALLAEALPVAGGATMVGLAAVPAAMLTVKPKMQVAATAARDGGK